MERGYGLGGQMPEETIRQAGRAAEAGGYGSFWLSHPPNVPSLPKLGGVAAQTSRIHLGVGVIPLSHHPIQDIVGEVDTSGIPLERLYLGIGSGSGDRPIERVRLGLEAIRAEVGVTLVVAALGPAMCRLAGEGADGVLFNWLTPAWAERSVRLVREGAERAGRATPLTFAYVRVALGQASIDRLRKEAASYSAIPHYGRHFERMGTAAEMTAITGTNREEIQRGLAPWDGIVDGVIVRAIPADDSPESALAILEAAAP